MGSGCKSRVGKSIATGVIIVFSLATVLAFAPSNSSAFFHKPQTAAKTSQVRPTPTPTPTPRVSSQAQKSAKPPLAVLFLQSLGRSLAAVGDFLWPFDEIKTPKAQAKDTKKKESKQVGQVLGEKDSKGPGFLSKFFKGVGNTIAGVLDFLWPFDGKTKEAKKDTKTDQAKAESLPVASPSPSPAATTELAQTGVETTGTGNVTVSVPDTITNDSLTIAGNLTFGDSTDDRLILKGLLESDLLLSKSKTYTLGNSGERFKSGYFSNNVFVGDELRLNSDGVTVKGSMYLNTTGGGSIYLDSDSNTLYLGAGTNKLSNADSEAITIDPTGSNRVQFHSSANFIDSSGNMTLAGTLTSASGSGISSDSLTLTPSSNIDALNIIGTNVTTASLIDLDPTGTTSGNIIDIDTSTAHSGHVISVDNTGNAVWTGNIIDVDTGTGDASGDVVNIAIEAGATDVQGIVVTNAAATDQAGWLMAVDASAAWTANAINFLQSAGISTADVIAYDNTGNTATTGDFISFASGTGDADGDVMDVTVEAGATSTQIFDINNAAVSDEAGWLMEVDTTGVWTGNAIDFTTGAQAWTGNIFDVNVGAAASTGDVFNVSMGSSNLAGGAYVIEDAGGIRTDALIDITTASTAATDAGSIMQINSTGLLATGANVLDVNMSGGASANVIDITTLTSATSGNMIDLNFGAVADTGDAINVALGATAVAAQALVVSATGASTTDGWVLAADNTGDGIWTGDMINIRTGTGDASGDIVDITMEAGATDAQAFVVANAAASDQAGWLMKVDTTGIFTTNMIDVDLGAQASTGDIMNVSMGSTNIAGGVLVVADAGGARTDALVDITSASTGDGTDASALLQLNATGLLLSGSNILDINRSAGAASNVIDITTSTTASAGNLVDLNFGAITDTGDAINIALGTTATGSQALVVSAANASTVDGWALAVDNTGDSIWTGDMINIRTGTGDASGDIVDITMEAGATDAQAFVVANAAASDQAGWLMKVDTTGIFTTNMFDIDLGAQLSTGDIMNVSMGSTNVAGGVLVVADAGGVRTDAIIDITSASTAATDAGSIMQINGTGIMAGANVFDINVSGGSTSGNVIDVTTSGTLTASNLIDLNFGAIADTGDAVNIALGATAVAAQALVVDSAGASSTDGWVLSGDNSGNGIWTGDMLNFRTGTGDASGDVFDLTMEAGATDAQAFVVSNAAISDQAGWLMDIDTSAAWTANMIDITTGAQAWTANMIDINVGAAAATGDVINIDIGGSAPAVQALVVSGTSSTATAGVIDLNIDTGAAQSATVVDITSTLGIMDGSDTFKGMNIAITGANHTGASNVIRGIDVALTTPDADATEIGINVNTNWDLGISSASGIGIGAQKTLTADSTTPSVAGTSHAITANLNATLYSNFTGGTAGQLLVIEVNDAFSTFDCIGSEATINCGGVDIAAAAGDILTWVYDGTIWNLVNWLDEGDAQTGADLAEYFGSAETLEPGDVVSADVTNPEYVRKSSGAYDSRLLGVVSTLPGLVIGDPNDLNQIALTGRVPVKVTNENGAIKAGDYLTSSGSKAGYAMRSTKPGPVVGMALSDFDGNEGTVVVFVKAVWFDPVEEQKRAVLAALGVGSASVLGATTSTATPTLTSDEVTTPTAATNPLVGPSADGSLGVLAEEVDLLVHGLLTATNLRVTTAAVFEGTLVVRGAVTFEGDLVVKGAFSTGSLDLSGALTKTMTAGSDLSAGDPVVVTGANTVARAGGPGANVVGLAASSASAGSSVRVAVAGTVGGYSGLAAGAGYYVGEGGVVTTAPGGDSAVHIGVAISGSEMIVQIYKAGAPPAPPVVDTATVDTGPTVAVSDGSESGSTSGGSTSGGSSETSSSPEPEASPTPTPSPEPSPLPLSGQASPSPEPTVAPTSSPIPEPSPSLTP